MLGQPLSFSERSSLIVKATDESTQYVAQLAQAETENRELWMLLNLYSLMQKIAEVHLQAVQSLGLLGFTWRGPSKPGQISF